jgi:hypothetical protein
MKTPIYVKQKYSKPVNKSLFHSIPLITTRVG